MNLYLVQHGQAKTAAEDPARPLNDDGVKDAEKMAKWLSRLDIEITEIWHSGKDRAEQTASIFGSYLSPPGGIAAVPNLNPTDDVSGAADRLRRHQDQLMLIGHLPFLSRLAGLLVAGNPECEVVQFQNAGVVALREFEGRWRIEWAVVPSITAG